MKKTKTDVRTLNRLIAAKTKEIDRLKGQEKKASGTWVKSYRIYRADVNKLTEVQSLGSKKTIALKKRIKDWGSKEIILTRARDTARVQIAKATEELNSLATRLAVVSAEANSQSKATDEIVKQVFSLNETVVSASKNRENYLTSHVFRHLLNEDGSPRSQVTFTSSDGLRRVTAMVNNITIVQEDLASEAKRLIEQFFERHSQAASMNESVKPLFELTRQLLVAKTKFKVGPDLYRFLGMELDQTVFPELHDAQRLLRASIRSEKTTSYIRIKERKSQADNWVDVRQS